MFARDRLGEWFQHLHDLGEDTEARVGRLPGDGGEVEWLYLPHQKFDGIDALRHALARHSIEARPDGVAAGVARRPPPLAVRAARAVAAMAVKRSPSRGWRAADPAWRADAARRTRPHAVAWTVLSTEETAAAADAARARGASTNSLLLWAVHRAVAPRLDDGPHPACWMVPVDMREALSWTAIKTNRVAFVDVRLAPEATIPEAHAEIRRQLAAGAHFTAWDAYQLAGALGMLPRRALRVQASPPRRTGVFSNVGAYVAPDDTGAWVLCPPPLRSTPFTACTVTYNGRLSLMVEIHPSIRATVDDARRIVDDFRSSLASAAV
jgi:hypothetical protein